MPRRRRPEAREGKDGRWHAWVTVGTKPNGRPDQRHISRDTKAAAEEAADELIDQARAGKIAKPGKKPTVGSWLDTYLGTVAPRKVDPTTIHGYRSKMRNYVLPVCGAVRLDRLGPEHLDAVYLRMQQTGKADSTILQTHRILTRALTIAYKRGLMTRNVAELVDAPTAKKREMQSLTEDAATAILAATELRRNSARWKVGFALGLRQGEALGLRRSYLRLADLDRAEMDVWWQLHRRPWEHGCGGKCGRRRGGNCPHRHRVLRTGEVELAGGLILKEPKGKSKRTLPIPRPLAEKLVAHLEVQDLERQYSPAYTDYDLVFAGPNGEPIDPAADWAAFKELLAAAGVPAPPRSGLGAHIMRHTAATLLLAQGVQESVVQELLGHSSIVVTRGYTHVASEMARAGVEALGKKLLRGSTP